MTPRERWLACLNGQRPDRVPTDYWATEEVTQRLLKEWGLPDYAALLRKLDIDAPAGAGPMMLPALLVLAEVLRVSPGGPIRSLTEALARAHPGDRIVVQAGTYAEPAIVVTLPVEIVGEGGPLFLGGAHHTIEIRADRVTIRGIEFGRVIPSMLEDRAAIFVNGGGSCRLEDNRVRDGFFGIYLKGSSGCRIAGNRISGAAVDRVAQGNGIHLWRSRDVVLVANQVDHHRDGIYFEFVTGALVRGNTVRGSTRYGLHFMRSDSCRYERNRFAGNGAGVAVMYSRWVHIVDNDFERNWGSAAYGLLLKEISDGEVSSNRFDRNTVGLYLDGANRNRVEANRFTGNGWAIRLLASAGDNSFERNVFLGNSFDVATNSRSASSTFRNNWWDRYHGYDLDRDSQGDVPFRPVRLFSLVVEQNAPALLLLRSPFVDLLDTAERLLPILTPETLVDAHPLMNPPAPAPAPASAPTRGLRP